MAEQYLVLGLDPGISSCGFALLDMNNHKILEMGSHLFDAPQESKTKVSLAVGRRNARSARRNNLRTKNRQKHCMKLLKEAGLVPDDATKQWFQSAKGDRPLLELRFAALERILTNREFAQILYALSARRGYIPHGEGRISKLWLGWAHSYGTVAAFDRGWDKLPGFEEAQEADDTLCTLWN